MIRYHRWLAPLMVHRDEVSPDPENPNDGDVDEITKSILVNGCYRPIYASRETTHVVAGHNLYQALLGLGETRIPVAWLDGDDEQARRILIGDNWIASLARINETQFLDAIKPLQVSELGLEGTGVTKWDLDRLAAVAAAPLERIRLPKRTRSESFLEHTCPECGHSWSD